MSVLVAVAVVALTIVYLMTKPNGPETSKTLKDPTVKYALPLVEKEVCWHHLRHSGIEAVLKSTHVYLER